MQPARQLLSLFATLALLCSSALAQQPPAGNDFVRFKPAAANAQPRVLQGVLITKVAGGKALIRDAAGEIGYGLETIDEIRKAAPAEVAIAAKAIEAGELDRAIPLLRTIADTFRGLPVAWARDAAAQLGGLYITAGNLSEAESAIRAYEAAYPGAGALVASVGKARLAAAKRQFGEAKSLASPVVEGVMQRKNVTRDESQLIGQAFLVLGQIAEGEGKLPEAMENYARTVAIFYQDRSAVATAQKRIDDLRKKGVAVP